MPATIDVLKPHGPSCRWHRLNRRLSLAQVKELTGISVGYLSDLENDNQPRVSREKLSLLAELYDVPLALLTTEPEVAVAVAA